MACFTAVRSSGDVVAVVVAKGGTWPSDGAKTGPCGTTASSRAAAGPSGGSPGLVTTSAGAIDKGTA